MQPSSQTVSVSMRERRSLRWLRACLACLLILISAQSGALTPSTTYAVSGLTFTAITPYAVLDANSCATQGPRAMYLEVVVTNSSGATLTDLVANFDGFSTAGFTLDAGESPLRYIGTLPPSATFPLYYYINYPPNAPCTTDLNTTYSITVGDGATPPQTSPPLALSTHSELSANAGGQVVSSTIGPGAVVGQIIPMTVNYSFGNPAAGAVALLQPAGNVSFDGGCFRLISVDITSSTFTAGPTTANDDRLFFTGVNGPASNAATVVYYFKMLCSGVSTTANPFSDLTSGGPEKYTGNFGTCSATGAICPSYPVVTNPFTISKSVSPSNLPAGGTATYTVVVNNTSAFATTIDKIADLLPPGVTFAALSAGSDVTLANSSSVPPPGATDMITFQGRPTTSCVGGTCNGTYGIAPNSSLSLIYTANVPNVAGSYINSASANVASTVVGPVSATVTVGTPGLSLSKSDSPASTTPGGTVAYTLTYQNTGNVPLTGVTLNETVPANTTFSAADSSGGWSCADGSLAGTGCTLTIGNLPVGVTASATFAVKVNSSVPAGTTQISNAATISEPSGTTASASDDTPVTTTSGLSIAKSDSPASTTPGGTVVYTLSYQNTGNVELTSITIAETVPANTTFSTAGSTAGWSCANGSLAGTSCVLTIGALAGGASGTATFAVVVNNPLPAGVTQLNNSATISDGSGITATGGDTTPVVTAPALTLTKSDGATTTTPGGSVVYTLSYQNTGNVGLTGVTIVETVPANTTFTTTGSTAGWSCANGSPAGTSCTLTIGNLASGASGSIAFAVVVDTPLPAGVSQLSNSASISDSGGTSASGSDTTPVTTTPGLSLSKSDGGVSTTPGATVVYTLNYQNTGNIGLTGVTIVESVPANTTFTAAGSTAGWSCASGSPAGTTCSLAIGSLPAGVSGSVIFVVSVVSPLPAGVSQINNAATIDDASGASATGSDTTPVNTTPGLSIAKSDGGASTTPGGLAVYTLNYQNSGNVNLTGVTISETVPANTTFAAGSSSAGWSCANGSPAGTSCVLTIGALAGGASGTATFAVTVDTPLPAGVSQISNAVTIGDGSGTTASSSDTTPVDTTPGLSLVKSDNGVTTVPGGTVIYTLSYQNTGNVGLAGVTIAETVPANSTFNLGSSTAGWSCANGSLAGTSCVLTIGALAGGASGTATFAVTVDNPLPAGVVQLSNAATIGDGSGTTATGSDTTPVLTTPGLSLSKSDGGATITPGGTVVYTLGYANTGNVGLAGVTIAETVPANSTFNLGSSTAGWSCLSGSSAGTSCVLTIGTLAAGASGTVNFAVTVNNPLPAGVTQLSNAATISDEGETTASNSDTTPIDTTPGLGLSKSDNNVSTAPGGTVVYTLSYQNTGNVGLTGVTIAETVPANSTFNAGSSTAGWSCANGSLAGTSCVLTLGTLPAGATGSVNFAVTAITPLPAGVSQLTNVATISDDSGTSTSGSDTTPVLTTPGLSIVKSDGGTTTTPGGTVVYTLSYQNTGNVGLIAVTINEIVPTNTTFTASGSTAGWSCANGSLAGTSCVLTIGTLAAGASGTATFVVIVDNPLSTSAVQLSNAVTISGGGGTSASGSDTTPVSAAPILSSNKSALDLNGGPLQPSDVLEYTITIQNTGNTVATGVTLTDAIPANTTYVAGSTTLNGLPVGDAAGAMPYSSGAAVNSSGALSGQIGAGASATVVFHVTINNPLPASVTQIVNQGTVSSSELPPVSTNDPNTTITGDATVIIIDNPTAITLTSFTATRQGETISVRWTTSAELNTWGFYLYRSADGARTSAVRLTHQLILGQGRGQGGASYVWTDTDVQPGVSYTYWLQEVELGGAVNEYGPAASVGITGVDYRILLPLVQR